ncbi:hypothetical protein BDZ97DRAFT_1814805 [Flammula alnicola]|nr:hypothetical protein BDZ97DRAFT_1814805 [Flammula alnicola]
MSDLLQIGAHCSLPSCNVLDFLPTTCKCNKSFCSQHISPDRHACLLLNANFPSLRIYKGGTDETCTACQKSFCVDHRHPETHGCPSILNAKASTSTFNASRLTQWQKMEDKAASLPPDERLHVRVTVEGLNIHFGFERALDLLVKHLSLTFPANQYLQQKTKSFPCKMTNC